MPLSYGRCQWLDCPERGCDAVVQLDGAVQWRCMLHTPRAFEVAATLGETNRAVRYRLDGDVFAAGQLARWLALGIAVECERSRHTRLPLVSVHPVERATEGRGRLRQAAWAERRHVQLDGSEDRRPGVWVRP